MSLHPSSDSFTLHLCIAVDVGHSGLVEQSKEAEVLGKHISDYVKRILEDGPSKEVISGRGIFHAIVMKLREAE